MSAEGKKKRGESGRSKAKSSPYRLNGGGCYPSHLRKTLGSLAKMVGNPPKKEKQPN